MSALDDLKDRIDSAIYTNTEQNITGDGLQTVLDDMVDTMGVSVSQNTQTGKTELKIGDIPALIVDNEPTAGSDNLVKSGGVQNELALGAVYDVSAKNPTAGPNNDGKFTLEYILNQNNVNTLIPSAVRKGGMSIKFVQSSDNKYVRYNLLADVFTTDITQWAIDDGGVYVENPEFIEVKTDNEGKILWAIKTDGSIYWGAGVPSQVIDYVESKISELSFDEYEDIVTFLNNLEKGDKTLQTLLNEKVDKEEGKSLINSDFASTQESIESPEYLQVTTDSESKILQGIKSDGTSYIGSSQVVEGDLTVNRNVSINGIVDSKAAEISSVNNPEYIDVKIDSENKILEGIITDGTKIFKGDVQADRSLCVNGFIDNKFKSQSIIYDSKGNVSSVATKSKLGEVIIENIIRDENGRVNSIVERKNNTVLSTTILSYDENNRVINIEII